MVIPLGGHKRILVGHSGFVLFSWVVFAADGGRDYVVHGWVFWFLVFFPWSNSGLWSLLMVADHYGLSLVIVGFAVHCWLFLLFVLGCRWFLLLLMFTAGHCNLCWFVRCACLLAVTGYSCLLSLSAVLVGSDQLCFLLGGSTVLFIVIAYRSLLLDVASFCWSLWSLLVCYLLYLVIGFQA